MPYSSSEATMIAGLAPFAVTLILDVLILFGPSVILPGNATGAYAILLFALTFLAWILACMVLVPNLAHLLYRVFKHGVRLQTRQRWLVRASLAAIFIPPVCALIPA